MPDRRRFGTSADLVEETHGGRGDPLVFQRVVKVTNWGGFALETNNDVLIKLHRVDKMSDRIAKKEEGGGFEEKDKEDASYGMI